MVSSIVSSRSREKVLGGLRIGRILITGLGGNLGYLSRWAGNRPHRRTRERSAAFTIQFFANLSGNEGKAFVGQKNVTTNQKGNVTFTFTAAASIGTQNAT